MKKFMHDLTVKKVSLVNRAANKRNFLMFKSVEGGKMSFLELVKNKIDEFFSDEELRKAIAAEIPVDEGEDMQIAEIVKSQEEMLKSQQTEIENLKKSLEAAEAKRAEAAEQEANTLLKSQIEKFDSVPADKEFLFKLLKATKDTEVYAGIIEMLDKVNTLVGKSDATNSVGVTDTKLDKSAEDQLTAKVEELVKGGKSRLEALEQAYRENPDLYESYYENLPSVGDQDETD